MSRLTKRSSDPTNNSCFRREISSFMRREKSGPRKCMRDKKKCRPQMFYRKASDLSRIFENVALGVRKLRALIVRTRHKSSLVRHNSEGHEKPERANHSLFLFPLNPTPLSPLSFPTPPSFSLFSPTPPSSLSPFLTENDLPRLRSGPLQSIIN